MSIHELAWDALYQYFGEAQDQKHIDLMDSILSVVKQDETDERAIQDETESIDNSEDSEMP